MAEPDTTLALRTVVTPSASTVTWRSNERFRSIDTRPGSTGKLATVNDKLPLSHTLAGPPTGGNSHGITTSCDKCGEMDVVVLCQSGSPLFLTTRPMNASRLNVAVIDPLLDLKASDVGSVEP